MSIFQLNTGHLFDEVNGEKVTLAKLNRQFSEGRVTLLNPLPISLGGTGCSTAACVRDALGVKITDFNLLTPDASIDVATDLIAYFDVSESDHNTLTPNELKTALGLDGAGGAGSVSQVIQTVKATTASIASKTPADISGLSVTITPSSTSSKILVMAELKISTDNNRNIWFILFRDSTEIYIPAAASSRELISATSAFSHGHVVPMVMMFLDAPALDVAVTYKLKWRLVDAGYTGFLNRGSTDADTDEDERSSSTITVIEVQG